MRKLLFTLVLLGGGYCLNAQSGCPDCLIELPEEVTEDTIYLSEAASGQVGVGYENDVSFRLPKTTTPVNAQDPATPAGINLSEITILNVANVPPGLSWQANQLEFDVREQTDGCVRFCGTPLQPGIYDVEVVVRARIAVINETTSFTFPMEILPSESITAGFTTINDSGCGELLATYSNNVPSKGNPGITYSWDFGNGITSVDENPDPQFYDQTGSYEVSYQAIIDTIGFIMNEVVVNDVDCDDLLSRPDLMIKLFDPQGEEIFSSPEARNTQLPVSFPLNVQIDTGMYTLQVIEDDQGLEGGDKICAEVDFTQLSGGAFTGEGFDLEINIINPQDTINSLDTVQVFELPPVAFLDTEFFSSNFNTCAGDSIKLSIETQVPDIQWYQDSLPVGDGGKVLTIKETGSYWAVMTNELGCSRTTGTFTTAFPELPNEPVFVNDNNLLTVFDTTRLPEVYDLSWYLNFNLLVGINATSFCAAESGNYILEVVDLRTGCIRLFEQFVEYDPAFAGCTLTSTEELSAFQDLSVYPNPSEGVFYLPESARDLNMAVFNSQGQRLGITNTASSRLEVDLSAYPDGIYWLRFNDGNQSKTLKLLKSK